MRLGFIGTGVITEAIVTGLVNSDYAFKEVIVSSRNTDRSARLAALDRRVRVEDDIQRIVDEADVLFLAVRPQDAEAVLRPLNFRPDQAVASLIATLEAEQLQSWFNAPVRIARAIPLPAVAQRRGVTAIYPPDATLAALFSSLGSAVEAQTLDEFDAYAAASALMGLYFGVMESAAGWLGEQGAEASNARQYLSQVFVELARTAERAKGISFADLRVEHSTPGGLNQQLHEVFSESGGSDAIHTALDSVAGRIRDARK